MNAFSSFTELFELPPATWALAVSLGIGLLIGMERERRADTKAGLRTFALVGVLGCATAMLAEAFQNGWIVAVGLMMTGAMMIAAHLNRQPEDTDPGTTTVAALMLCFALGAMVWKGYVIPSVMVAIAVTLLLYFKTQLHGFTTGLQHGDLLSVLQFAVLSLIILPILPDRDFGPYEALNLRQIWWMVVLVSGISLAGYAALRVLGAKGVAMVGFFGGLVSSTATTLLFARHSRDNENLLGLSTVVILLANLTVLLRLGVVVGLLAPALLPGVALVFGCGLLLGLSLVLVSAWRVLLGHEKLPLPKTSNPTELRVALTFGLLYGAILLLSAWLQDWVGHQGLYLLALASGLTDVDAITLSTLRLFNTGKTGLDQVLMVVVLAIISNTCFKAALITSIGGPRLARKALPTLAAMVAGLIVGLVVYLA